MSQEPVKHYLPITKYIEHYHYGVIGDLTKLNLRYKI